VRLATMHRIKGLEFDRVIIAGVNDGVLPYRGPGAESSDPMVQREFDTRERALLYVTATRGKQEVLVTSFGKPSRFL
jgi:superfamily I DNA/RNA helicase